MLPETCATGYVSPRGDFDLSHCGEPVGGLLTRAWSALARAQGVALIAPIVEAGHEKGVFYNTTLVHDAAGALVARYRKHHPWFPETWATPGDTPVATFVLSGVAFALFVCFDVHFVSAEARNALDAARVLVFPSAWVEGDPSEGGDRGMLLAAMARAHDACIVNANWGAGAPRVRGQGGSMIVNARGERVGVTHELPEGCRAVIHALTLTEEPHEARS